MTLEIPSPVGISKLFAYLELKICRGALEVMYVVMYT